MVHNNTIGGHRASSSCPGPSLTSPICSFVLAATATEKPGHTAASGRPHLSNPKVSRKRRNIWQRHLSPRHLGRRNWSCFRDGHTRVGSATQIEVLLGARGPTNSSPPFSLGAPLQGTVWLVRHARNIGRMLGGRSLAGAGAKAGGSDSFGRGVRQSRSAHRALYSMASADEQLSRECCRLQVDKQQMKIRILGKMRGKTFDGEYWYTCPYYPTRLD